MQLNIREVNLLTIAS